MSNLSSEQETLKASIEKSAGIWGAVLGLAAGGIAYWALGGQSGAIQMGGAAAIGVGVLVGIRSWRIKANSAAAACGECSATFSITRTDRAEKLLSSTNQETRDAQPDYSTKVTTWMEDTIEVTDTYTCAKCDNATTKQYTKTAKRDEVETIEAAPQKGKPDSKTKAPSARGTSTSQKPSAPKDEGGFFSAAIDPNDNKK